VRIGALLAVRLHAGIDDSARLGRVVVIERRISCSGTLEPRMSRQAGWDRRSGMGMACPLGLSLFRA